MIIKKSERKRLILDKILDDKFVTLEDLVTILDTSESTVRRDLDELEKENQLRRVHGGAEALHFLQGEMTNAQKSIKNVQKKKAIARYAKSLIESGDIIFIDAGTTNELLIERLDQEDLIVVTNSINHAAKLVDKGINTTVIGGYVKQSTNASVGSIALAQIKQLNFDKAFIGMNGIDENYLTTPDVEEAVIKQTIIENAQQAYVLADASKINQKSFVKVASIDQVSIITNHSDSEVFEKIKEKTKVVEV